MKRINGGYYIKARQIQQSKIAHAPPSIREMWDWLLMQANHTDTKYDGFIVKRGQLFRTYKEIQEGLVWHVGWRKMRYSENHVKKAMKFLRRELMIATTKALGGVLITILNYDFYQDPKNYEGTNEGTNEGTIEEPLKNQPLPNNNKKVKKVKKVKNKETITKEIVFPSCFDNDDFKNCLKDFKNHRKELKKSMTDKAEELLIEELQKLTGQDSNLAIKIMKKSIFSGWQGVFELKGEKTEPSPPKILEKIKPLENPLKFQDWKSQRKAKNLKNQEFTKLGDIEIKQLESKNGKI